MIKSYAVIFVLLITGVVFSQETISFEASEGFTLGTLNTQNGWEVTDDNQGGFLLNQVVTNEQASDGVYSFKNGYEPDFGSQWFGIMGAAKVFDAPKSYEDFTFSYDVFLTELDGSNFEMTLYSVDALEDYVPVAGIIMDFEGEIYVVEDIYYGANAIPGATWTPNTWINFKIEVSATELKYYLDEVLVYTDTNFSSMDIHGFNMLHDNFGGDAYYDNFSIVSQDLGVADFKKVSDFRIFPNPVQDVLRIQGDKISKITQVTIYNLNGQKLLKAETAEMLNVSSLSAGVYILKIDTQDNKTHAHKLLKN
ncbi:MAG: T9SS type A sorting domain-containing protein [Xanthomarina sp.]